MMLIAFMTKVVFELVIALGFLSKKRASLAIVDTYLDLPFEIIPILYILHSHHVVFKEVARLRSNSANESLKHNSGYFRTGQSIQR